MASLSTTAAGSCCAACGELLIGKARALRAEHVGIINSGTFVSWSLRMNRSAKKIATLPVDGRLCSPCYNYINKGMNVRVCCGCGETVDGGRLSENELREKGWRSTDPEKAATVQELTGYVGDSSLVAANDKLYFCNLCRLLVSPSRGDDTGAGMDSTSLYGEVKKVRASLREAAVGQGDGLLHHPELFNFLVNAAAQAWSEAVKDEPIWSSELFLRFVLPAYSSLCPEYYVRNAVDVRSTLFKRYNPSRMIARLRTLADDGIIFVSLPTGSVRVYLMASSVQAIARALHTCQNRDASLQESGDVMVAELRAWARKHAVAEAVKDGTTAQPFRQTPALDLLATVSTECPHLYRFLEQLVPERGGTRTDRDRSERREEFGTRTSTSHRAVDGHIASPPRWAVRRAYIVSLLAFASSQRATEPFHAVLAAVARMDGASEDFIKALNRLGCTVSARSVHRHLDKLAKLGDLSIAAGANIPLEHWLVCALDNLDWTSRSRTYGRPAKTSNIITSVLLHGNDPGLPPANENTLKPVPLPPISGRLIHELSDAEKAAFKTFDTILNVLAGELAEKRRGNPASGPTPPTSNLQLASGEAVSRVGGVDSGMAQSTGPTSPDFSHASRPSATAAPSIPKYLGASDPKNTVRVNIELDTRRVVPIFIASKSGALEHVNECLKARYLGKHPNVAAANFSYTVDGARWVAESSLESIASRLTHIHAKCEERSLRLRFEEAIHHSAEQQKATLEFGTPQVGASSDHTVVAATLDHLKKAANIGNGPTRKSLLVAGDFQTYAIMLKLKAQFPALYDWLLPWIGDWHLLWHLQCCIIGRYWHFGLAELAELDLGSNVAALAHLAAGKRFEDNAVFIRRIVDTLARIVNTGKSQQGPDFLKKRSAEDKTFALWANLLEDATAVVGLHTAIRTGNFDLRQACLKKLSYLFHIQGKYNYQQLVTSHLKQVAQLSEYQAAIAKRHFSVNIWGHAHCSTALDEILEKTVNRTGKGIVRSTDGVQAKREISAFAVLHDGREYLRQQLGLSSRPATFPVAYLVERVVDTWLDRLEPLLLPSQTRTKVMNLLSGAEASTDAIQDQFLRGREIGDFRLKEHILRHAYGRPSAPLSGDAKVEFGGLPARLATLAPKKATDHQRNKRLEGALDELEVARMVCEEIAAREASGILGEIGGLPATGTNVVTAAQERLSRDVLRAPLCFTDGSGGKLKNSKATFAPCLARILGLPGNALFQGRRDDQRADFLIHDALVSLHTGPQLARTFGDYAAEFWGALIEAGVTGTVADFDNMDGFNVAKVLERMARRARGKEASSMADIAIKINKSLRNITASTVLPPRGQWADAVIGNDENRRLVIAYLREYLLKSYEFPEGAAAKGVFVVIHTGDGVPVMREANGTITTPDDMRTANLEADYNVLFFARKLQERAERDGKQEPIIWIQSIDTDVWVYCLLAFGTGAYRCGREALWVRKKPNEVLNIGALAEQLRFVLPQHVTIADVIGCFVLAGCDYTPRWAGFTHRSMLDDYLSFRNVLRSVMRAAGSPDLDNHAHLVSDVEGKLFIDEAVYTVFISYMFSLKFKKSLGSADISTFVPSAGTVLERCRSLYETIKSKTMFATKQQCFRMPSYEAAHLHRKRGEFVLLLPRVGLQGGAGFPNVLEHGYALLRPSEGLSVGNLGIQWDAGSVSAVVTSGSSVSCACKGGCSNKRCACRKQNQVCTTTCRCKGCENAEPSSSVGRGNNSDVMQVDEKDARMDEQEDLNEDGDDYDDTNEDGNERDDDEAGDVSDADSDVLFVDTDSDEGSYDSEVDASEDEANAGQNTIMYE